MHWHGYIYSGRKGPVPRFDAFNRDPEGGGFSVSPFPPNLMAHWLRKPAGFIEGTWTDPSEATEWAGQLLEGAYGSLERMVKHSGVSLRERIDHGTEDLSRGNDQCWSSNGMVGHEYAEIYVICCPNAAGTASCPRGMNDTRPEGASKLTGVP